MKYYAMMDERLCGPFEAETLTRMPGCTRRTLVQPQERLNSDHPRWSEAGEVPLLAVLMDSRDRGGAPARFSLPRHPFGTPGRRHELETANLNRETIDAVAAQEAALAGARSEFGRIVGRLEALEGAVRGVRTAVYCGTAVVGLVGILAVTRLLDARREPAAVAAAPEPAPALPAAEQTHPSPRPAAAPRRPAAPKELKAAELPSTPSAPTPSVSADDEAEAAVELVQDARLPAAGAARCPRSVAEARTKLGTPARTPREASACAAMDGVLALYDSLVVEHRWPEAKAARLLDRVVRERGGLDAVFPPTASARRLAGRTYAVELGRRDLLTPALSLMLDADIAPSSPKVLRYRADLDSGEVRLLRLDPKDFR